MKRGIIFDLDGTLTNTLQDIAYFMNSILRKYGFPEHETESYRYKVGGGMRNLVVHSLPEGELNDPLITKCEKELVELYYENPVVKTELYDGIPGILRELEKKGVPLGICSNKTHELVMEVVNILLSSFRFQSVWGSKREYPKKPDPASVLEVAKEIGCVPGDILYFGDSGVDMETARNAGMTAVGVLWGFRDREELIEHGAEKLVKQPEEILQLL